MSDRLTPERPSPERLAEILALISTEYTQPWGAELRAELEALRAEVRYLVGERDTRGLPAKAVLRHTINEQREHIRELTAEVAARKEEADKLAEALVTEHAKAERLSAELATAAAWTGGTSRDDAWDAVTGLAREDHRVLPAAGALGTAVEALRRAAEAVAR